MFEKQTLERNMYSKQLNEKKKKQHDEIKRSIPENLI